MFPASIEDGRRLPRLTQNPTHDDRFAERVDLLALEVRLRGQLDHVVVVRRTDRRVDGREVTTTRTHRDRRGKVAVVAGFGDAGPTEILVRAGDLLGSV